MKKIFLSVLLVLSMTAGVVLPSYAYVQNADGTFTGKCEDRSASDGLSSAVKWTLDPKTNTLTVSGKGNALITDRSDIFSVETSGGSGWQIPTVRTLIFSEGITDVSGFYLFKDVSSIKFPNSLTSIGKNYSSNFKGNSALSDVTIPKNVTSINGRDTFSECSSLKTLRLPKGIRTIESSFFGTYLDDVYYDGSEEEWNIFSVSFPSEVKDAAVHFGDNTPPPSPAPENDFYTVSGNTTVFHVPVTPFTGDDNQYTNRQISVMITNAKGIEKGFGQIESTDFTSDKLDVTVNCSLNVGDKIQIKRQDY